MQTEISFYNTIPLRNEELQQATENALSQEQQIAELWLPIKGYEGLYEVSNYGQVKTLKKPSGLGSHCFKKEKIKKARLNKYGYYDLTIWKSQIPKHYQIHKLVALHFVDNPFNKPFINHIDGIKTNNCYNNLQWCTASENTRHAFKTGLMIPRKKESFSVAEIEKLRARCVKKVLKISVSGIILNEYPSIVDAARDNSLNPQNIYQAIYRKSKSHGFYWFLKNRISRRDLFMIKHAS